MIVDLMLRGFLFVMIVGFIAAVYHPKMAHPADLTASDIRNGLAQVGVNPGTAKLIGDKGVHQITHVAVSGRRGHWTVVIREREIHR